MLGANKKVMGGEGGKQVHSSCKCSVCDPGGGSWNMGWSLWGTGWHGLGIPAWGCGSGLQNLTWCADGEQGIIVCGFLLSKSLKGNLMWQNQDGLRLYYLELWIWLTEDAVKMKGIYRLKSRNIAGRLYSTASIKTALQTWGGWRALEDECI